MAKQETPEEKSQRETTEKIAKNISALAKGVVAVVDRVLSSLENLEKDWLK